MNTHNLFSGWAWLGVLFLAAVFVFWYRFQQKNLHQLHNDIRVLKNHQQQIEEKLKTGQKATLHLLERIKSVEQKTRAGEMQLDHMAQNQGSEKNYSEAIKRVKKGAEVEELVAHCHLMPNEAQLIIMMHGKK